MGDDGIEATIKPGKVNPMNLEVDGCSITLFTTVTDLLGELYGSRTVNQEEFNWLTKSLGNIEEFYQKLQLTESADSEEDD